MTEPTTAEKCRVVAKRWLGAEHCWWHSTLAADAWCLGNTTNDHVRRPIPDIPNDPVAASALWDALEADGYHLRLFGGRSNHFVRLLLPYQNASWHGRSENKWAALLEAAYQATIVEKGD